MKNVERTWSPVSKRPHTRAGMTTKPRQIRTIPKLPRRARDAHKGAFGRALVVGGSRGMVGAPSLVANSALRSGAGLVTVAVPACIQQTAAALVPCATSIALPYTGAGLIHDDGEALAEAISQADVIAFGPGLGAGDAALDQRWHRLLTACSAKPVVIDADGLNLLSRLDAAARGAAGARWVLTPHPGEMGRLIGRTTAGVQQDRLGSALRCREQLNTGGEYVVVLKGAGTIVTDGQRVFVNGTGNPGMATGGAGDVLTGVIAALIGQGLSLFDAAVLGVHVHGLAGDLAAKDLGEVSLIASDLIDYLPAAFRKAHRR